MFGALACLSANHALAQNYPTQPLRIVVPASVGSTLDALARIIGGELQRTWGKQVTVENRPGENGNAGMRYAAMAPADGHTMLMIGTNFAANPILGENAGYDPMLNFAPVSELVSLPTIAVVHPIFPAQNVKTLVEVLTLSPGQFSYASAGYGTSLHLAAEAFKHATKIQMLHVPFKNSKQAEAAVIGGDVQIVLAPLATAMPMIQAGRVRPLAIGAPERHQALLDVPTMAQAGVESYDFTAWVGVAVPANTPAAIVQKLSDHLGKIVRQPKLKQRLGAQYVEIVGSTPQQFTALIQKDQVRWHAIAEEAKRAATRLEQSLQPQTETVEDEMKAPPPPKPEATDAPSTKAPMPPKSGSAAKPKDAAEAEPDAMDAESSEDGAAAEPAAATKPAPAPSKPAAKKSPPKSSAATPPASAAKSAPAAADSQNSDSSVATKTAAPPKPESAATKPTAAKPTTAQPAATAPAIAKPTTPGKTGTTTPSTATPKTVPDTADVPREVLPGKPAQ